MWHGIYGGSSGTKSKHHGGASSWPFYQASAYRETSGISGGACNESGIKHENIIKHGAWQQHGASCGSSVKSENISALQ